MNLPKRNKDKNYTKNYWLTIKEQLPEYYKNYLAICKDPDYLLNKTNACLDEVELIGIDSRITIAPEVEADCHNSLDVDFGEQNDFSMSLRDKGITPLFSEHIDPTVSQGKEINCTPFHDTKEELARFKAVMDMYRDIGYYYDEEKHDASGQINLGLDYLDTKEAILYFYQIYANVEELLFYIINPVGQVMRQPLIQNSRFKPISQIIGKRTVNEDMSRDEAIKLFWMRDTQIEAEIKGLKNKKNTVCLRGNYRGDQRLEFRIPNGGVNYQSYIDNIRLYGKIMEVAKTVADALLRGELNSEEERLLRLIYDLEDVPQPDDYLGGQNFIFDIRRQYLEEKLDLLMDLLFTDEKVKNIYRERFEYVVNRIKQDREVLLLYTPYNTYEPGFAPVEFVEKADKHAISPMDEESNNLNGVITYDPNDEYYTENGVVKKI